MASFTFSASAALLLVLVAVTASGVAVPPGDAQDRHMRYVFVPGSNTRTSRGRLVRSVRRAVEKALGAAASLRILACGLGAGMHALGVWARAATAPVERGPAPDRPPPGMGNRRPLRTPH